jgi:ribonuclease HI
MKKIKIYSIGSCDPFKRIGSYSILLKYKDECKRLSSVMNNTTSNRCIIKGFIEGVKLVKEPCSIEFITSTPIGISSYLKKGKGVNKDLISELLNLIDNNNCEYIFTALEGEADSLKKIIEVT